MANRYTFREHGMEVSGSREELIALAKELRTAEGTLGDLRPLGTLPQQHVPGPGL